MHHHAGGAGGAGGGTDLLPLWLQLAWLGVVAGCTAWFVVRALTVRASFALHTAVHVGMGVGMLVMFAPWAGPVSVRFWQVAYVALAVALAAGRVRGLPLLDAAAMAYMFLLVDGGSQWVTYGLAGLYVLLAAGWAHGAFGGPRLPQAATALAMAYMLLAMDADAAVFLGRAFGGPVTEQTYWALALCGLALRVFADGPLVRRLMGGRAPAAPSVAVGRRPVLPYSWGHSRTSA